MSKIYNTIIVGAGPGGLTVGAALHDVGVEDVVILEKGEIGQAWLDYPSETHLLSGSDPGHDDNEIADVCTSEVFPNIPHPSHVMFSKYLEYVAEVKDVAVKNHVEVKEVKWNEDEKLFYVIDSEKKVWKTKTVVWAAGMYSTPSQDLNCHNCSIHYAQVPDLEEIAGTEVTVVGSGNGASGVVMQLAKPGRKVTLLSPHPYEIPLPIDCLWKENMEFVKQLEQQGLVEIIENFRAKNITKKDGAYILHGTEPNQIYSSSTKPIVCIGFEPTIEPIECLVETRKEGHQTLVNLDASHQSRQQAGLFLAGVCGILTPDQGFIRFFRYFGKPIAEGIQGYLASHANV